MAPFDPARRRFLQGSAAALALTAPFSGLLAARERAAPRLVPTACQATGLELLELPPGCEYRSFGWKGEPLADGTPTPGRHDGMAIVREHAGVLTLVRNHEEYSDDGAFTAGPLVYDRMASGGCTVLEFDTRAGVLRSARTGLAGTSFNCAGGATPWGTWLSGEEWLLGPGDQWRDRTRPVRFEQPHGFVFEVDPARLDAPRPLPALGRFQHEAAAVDPHSGIVYLTEDRSIGGFYRFLPTVRGDLAAGGRLQMLEVRGLEDARGAQPRGEQRAVRWVDIPDPGLAHTPGTRDAAGVVGQGLAQGATRFARLEGCWYRDDVVWFASTTGGAAGCGQVWRYDVRAERLSLFYESPDVTTLDSPDNLTVTPRGALLLCEDGDREATLLHLLTRDGRLVPLARNAARLEGAHLGHAGDFRGQEFAGVCMDAAGRWLFLNLQTPGISFAIRGPWRELGL
jgi:secreted PhoX family phosphatase